MRGNVIDMAVGVVMGIAFGKVISSLVDSIINPVVGLLVGGVNFTSLRIVLKEATETAGAVSIDYGVFLQNVFDFILVAFAMFMVIKAANRVIRSQPPSVPREQALLQEIRDILKSK